MTNAKAADVALVERAAAGLKHSVHGPQRISCPMCEVQKGSRDNKESLAVWPSGWFQCWRCKGKGFIKGTINFVAIAEQEPPIILAKPGQFLPFSDPNIAKSLVAKPALKYMANRRVTLAMLVTAGAGLCLEGYHAGRVIFPVYSKGVWVGHVARSWVPNPIPYLYPSGFARGSTLWNGDILNDKTDEAAMICEGVLDALPYWPRAAALLGKVGGDHEALLMQAKRPIVICLDGDAWEEGWALAQKLTFMGAKAAAVALPAGYDPAEVDAKWLLAQVEACVFRD